jgi:hypothetical protein
MLYLEEHTYKVGVFGPKKPFLGLILADMYAQKGEKK